MLEDHRSGPRHDSLMSPYREDDSGSIWMVSYIDIMTLLVALFVIIIAAAGATSPTWMATEPPPEPLFDSPPPLGVPLPEPLANIRNERDRSANWLGGELLTSTITAAQGVAGRPRRTTRGVPPLLAMPDPVAEPLAALPEPRLPMPLVPVEQPALQFPLADYMVVLTDNPPSNVETLSDDAIDGALALREQVERSPYLPDLEGVEVSRVEEGISLRVQDRLLFPSAEARLTNDGGELISSLLDTIQRYDGEVWVEGHTDSRTIDTPEYSSNWALSSARAIAIVEALEAAGVASDRLRAVGLAATQSLADNDTAEGRARNRRVEVVIHVE
ncbi:chemotaxis protein MotB [Vreelandella subterranea]|uniref:Chemotaxis protein MotB n=2 Tax=Vreelandella subterranea TaxID=416874 RepID=A0A1H9ULI7_9GAMM|nr:OmpA family protein [Halomonas subterranea]SES10158.1 chemotaxis protein MotB [Halomonas subterranea]